MSFTEDSRPESDPTLPHSASHKHTREYSTRKELFSFPINAARRWIDLTVEREQRSKIVICDVTLPP